jgi:hypothetical protein
MLLRFVREPAAFTTRTTYYEVPFVTIAQKDHPIFSMFDDLQGKYHWALPLLVYPTPDRLLATFKDKVVNEAQKNWVKFGGKRRCRH